MNKDVRNKKPGELVMHPLNLGLRFILEMTMLFAIAFWGWTQHEGWLKYFLSIGLPVLFAIIWGVFAVPNDPSRSGKTVVVTPGWIRLVLEIIFFMLGFWALNDIGYRLIAFIYLLFVILHYSFSISRLRWIIKQ